MQAPNTGSASDSATGAQQSSSERYGRIPISTLIDPTDEDEGGQDESQQPVVPDREMPTRERSRSSPEDQPSISLPPRIARSMSNDPSPSTTTTQHSTRPFPYQDSESSDTALDRTGASLTNSDLERRPRPPRPSYSEEQKFFIMYARIMRERNWVEIEDEFADIFGQRSKGGLTSVYYRVRRDWGLTEVLKSAPGSLASDIQEVERRAANFSIEFLTQIGYIDRGQASSSANQARRHHY